MSESGNTRTGTPRFTLTGNKSIQPRRYLLILGVSSAAAAVMLVATIVLATFVFVSIPLNDFTFTFYRAGNYLLHNENVYLNSYPNIRDGREYPPYSPIWVIYPEIPLALLPLHFAEALRFLVDLILLPLMTMICANWGGLKTKWKTLLLAIAPWFAILVLAGQVSILVFSGILLSYFGIRRANHWMLGVGVWLLLLKPHIVALILLAVIMYAWRNRVLLKSLVVLFGLAFVSSLAQPLWVRDLVMITIERLKHPQILESVLLLPGYPYSQLILVMLGGLVLFAHFIRSSERVPSKWVWSVLVTVSLIGGLHTVPYDWLNLMLPLAILMRQSWGVRLTIALYVYPLIWGLFLFGLDWRLVSPTVIPSLILCALFMHRFVSRQQEESFRKVSSDVV